ncbi:MAG: ACT domain-containing protein [Oscillospiraceae bacterium]
MLNDTFLVIEKSALPEIYEKVLYVTSLLDCGEAKNTSEAVKLAGISRSVYYKYKDSVFSYKKSEPDGIITVQVVLMDRPGVLVNFLTAFYEANTNILTVTQNIPLRGRAFVSVSARINDLSLEKDALILKLKAVKGVLKIDSLSD